MPVGSKLRFKAPNNAFQVALIEPEIPQNTGSIARTCVATGTTLALVGPLGFDISERAVRRAGLDYWPHLSLKRHEETGPFLDSLDPETAHFFSSEASTSYLDAEFRLGDTLVFGRESVGLPAETRTRFAHRLRGIPTAGHVRSLNLSNAVAITLFEALRSVDALTGSSLAQ